MALRHYTISSETLDEMLGVIETAIDLEEDESPFLEQLQKMQVTLEAIKREQG